MGRSQRLVDLIDMQVRAHTVERVKRSEVQEDGSLREVSVLALDDLTSRLRLLVACDDQPAVADGYSSTTPGNGSPGSGKGGGKTMAIPDDLGGPPDHVPTSSTEAAALSLVTERSQPDPVHTMALQAVKAYQTINNQLSLLSSILVRFEHLRSASKVPDPPQCYVAQLRHQLPWDAEWEPWRTTDFKGKLKEPFDEPRKVCKFVYWFVYNHKRLPSRNEMLNQLGVRIKVKAS